MKPHISFFGSSLVSAYWNGAATYYRGIIRALSERGYRVTFYEPDAYERQQHRDIADPPWAEVVVYSGTDQEELFRMLERSRRSDILVKASGVGVFDDLLEASLPSYAAAGAQVVFWDVDAPATLDRVERDHSDPWRTHLTRYDWILTYGGGPPIVERYLALGARRCVPIYNALDASTHFAVPPKARFLSDLSLLANRLPDRERRVDDFFLAPAAAMPHARFLLGGNGWDDKAVPRNVERLGHVYTRDHNALNSSARMVLNVARDSMAENGFSPATRVFEAAGAAACIVTDAWRGLEEFLEPESEVLVARSGQEVAEIMQRYDLPDARRIGEAARRRVLAHHTYAHRAQQLDLLLTGSRPTWELGQSFCAQHTPPGEATDR